MKRIIALLLVGIMSVGLLGGCGNGSDTSASTTSSASGSPAASGSNTSTTSGQPRVLNVGMSSAVSTLSPFALVSMGMYSTVSTYYETLLAFNRDRNMYQNQVAKSVTKVDDTTYDIEIYDYVTDSKGNKITADDIKYDYDTAVKEGKLAQALGLMNSIEKTGDYTLRLKMKSMLNGALETVLSAVPVIAKKEYEASKDQMATSNVGTGRYVITKYVAGSSISVKKRADYWQKDELCADQSQGPADEVNFITIPEDSQLAIALETGTVNVTRLQATTAGRFIDNKDFDQFTTLSPSGFMLYFNGDSHSPFAGNKELRQAVCYAFDRQAFGKGAYNGYYEDMHELAVPDVAGYQKKWLDEDFYNYDPAKAKELLAKAGYKPGQLNVKLLVLNMPVYNTIATVMQAELAEIGITLTIESKDAATWLAQKDDGKSYDLLMYNVASNDMTMNWAVSMSQEVFGKDRGSVAFVKDDKMEELLQGCMKVNNHTDENIQAAHEYMKDMAYYYPTVCPKQYAFASKDLELSDLGYAMNALLLPSFFKFK